MTGCAGDCVPGLPHSRNTADTLGLIREKWQIAGLHALFHLFVHWMAESVRVKNFIGSEFAFLVARQTTRS